jgi:hypothetical protein
LDFDGNHNSPGIIQIILENLQVSSDAFDVVPQNLDLYTSIFVCLGTYPNNYVLSEEEGQVLADYLNNGGRIYMEGGDTWYYDQQFDPTPVHDMFGLRGEADGSGDLTTVQGLENSIASGMIYNYVGDNSYIDHIVTDGGDPMFENTNPQYLTTVSYDAGSYRTIGSSMEFGGLADGDYTKEELMIHILEFFGINGIWTSVNDRVTEETMNALVFPNPVSEQGVVRFTTKEDSWVGMYLYNMNGQEVGRFLDTHLPAGSHEVRFNRDDISGNFLNAGVYFIRLQLEEKFSILKIIVTD